MHFQPSTLLFVTDVFLMSVETALYFLTYYGKRQMYLCIVAAATRKEVCVLLLTHCLVLDEFKRSCQMHSGAISFRGTRFALTASDCRRHSAHCWWLWSRFQMSDAESFVSYPTSTCTKCAANS